MAPDLSRVSSLTRELALLCQKVLAWLPLLAKRRSTAEQVVDYCNALRRHLLLLRRHRRSAWEERFAEVAGREGFTIWDGDTLESAHQAVIIIAARLLQLLGGRRVAQDRHGPCTAAHVLRLQTLLNQLVPLALPGLELSDPVLPRGILHALAWELRAAEAQTRSIAAIPSPQPDNAAPAEAQEIKPNSEWERLGPECREVFSRFMLLGKEQAAAKEIIGHAPAKTEQGRLQKLVHLGYLRKPGGESGKSRRGYCLGRTPEGYLQPKAEA